MNNPFYYFSVWRGKGKNLVGCVLTITDYQALIDMRYSLHSFAGRRATVAVVSSDKSITRNEKLAFAIKFMEGKLETTIVDLDKLTTTTVKVIPPP